MTFSIYTLGCKVNFYESEFINNLLTKNNYIEKDFNDFCDVYIINTCTVTNTSDSKSMKMIRSARKKNKEACVIAIGCFVESSKEKVEDILKEADIVIGNKDKSKIPELTDKYFKERKKITKLYKLSEKEEFEDMFIDKFSSRTRAFVKIQDGCENFCSFCIIPYVRGKRRSKKISVVLDEIRTLVNNNYKEIVLTGIHTGSYGVDINSSLSKLLEEIVKIDGLERIRISSIEITEIDDNILRILKKYPIVVSHLHIPLQSGSNKILKSMNRKYDLKYFEEKLNKIRKIRPSIAITTDVIVGFPGEDDNDFNDTIDTVKKFEFAKIHVFPYSLRAGTKASYMENQVEPNIKKDRVKKLIEVSSELEKKYLNKFIGKKIEVLVENSDDSYSYGHSKEFLYAKIKGSLDTNRLYDVEVESLSYPYVVCRSI